MAFNSKIQEQIQRYLDGEMSASELQNFEQTIAANEDLAQEIGLQKDIANTLADTPENALRKNLQTLNERYQDQSSNGQSWKNFLWLLPLVLIFGIWWFGSSGESNNEAISNPNPTETLGIPTEPSNPPTEVDSSYLKPTNPQTPEETTPPTKEDQKDEAPKAPKKESSKAPVYADKTEETKNNTPVEPPMIMAAPSLLNHDFFATLPLLDSLVAQNFQSDKFQIEIQQRIPDTLALEKAIQGNFPFTSTLSITEEFNLSEKDFGLYLYPNHIFYWKENHPWDFTAANMQTKSTNSYQIEVLPNLNLEAGLYYYALRASKKGEVFFVGKLVIVE
ncbi:MAG: hypothetical protein AAFP82_19980 [Bacteroidota bacterium]